jgi:hypothetical protein
MKTRTEEIEDLRSKLEMAEFTLKHIAKNQYSDAAVAAQNTLDEIEGTNRMNMREAREEAKRRFGPTAMLTTSRYQVKPDGTRMKLVGKMSLYGPGGNWLGQGWTWEEAFKNAEKQGD